MIRKLLLITASLSVLFVLFAPRFAEAACPSGEAPLSTDNRVCCPIGKTADGQVCFFAKYVNPLIKLFATLAGVAVIIGLMLGGIQYAGSGGDPQKAAAGKNKVVKAIYGLVAFLLLFTVLQFLTPGGLGGAPRSGTANASSCSYTFLTLKPWFAYLPATDSSGQPTFDSSCQVQNFQLLPSGSNTSELPAVLLAIADDLLRIVGLVAVAYVIIGGVGYITSQGEPDRTKKSQQTIINALIGLAIAIVASTLVSYVGRKISS